LSSYLVRSKQLSVGLVVARSLWAVREKGGAVW